MLKHRIIPVLTFDGVSLVKTKKFNNPRIVGNPIQAAKVFNKRNVDELVFLDITATSDDRDINLFLVEKILKECFMPVSVGGGIRNIDDIKKLLKIGADKVVIKSKALTDINFIKEAVEYFGSQCISISVDAYEKGGKYFIQNSHNILIKLDDFVDRMNECQVGELLVNSVDNDGTMEGFDISLIKVVEKLTKTPIVAIGGAGNISHFSHLFNNTTTNSVGASSIFHFTQFTPNDIKQRLKELNYPIRIING